MRRFEGQLQKDILGALKLRYLNGTFTSEPFQLDGGLLNGSVSLTPTTQNDGSFDPKAYEIQEARVEALDMLITRWATVVAIRVETSAPDYRIKLNWLKKSNRIESKIVLIDPVNGHYYYPLATDLAGDVVPGVPKTGLVAFEPFRDPASELQLRISGAQFTAEKFEPELIYQYKDSSLASHISESMFKPSLVEEITTLVDREVAKGQQTIQDQLKKSQGCLILLAPLLLPLLWLGFHFLR